MIPHLLKRLEDCRPVTVHGRVLRAVGLTIEGSGPVSSIGQSCRIFTAEGAIDAEVVGFRDDRVLFMPLGEMRGIGPGSRVAYQSEAPTVSVGSALIGRVIDGLGRPIDGKGDIVCSRHYPLYRHSMNPLERERITRPLDVGIRTINALLTCGTGQKLGIFAGSGVGKSVLLGMICRHTAADINVVALIGERGREVKEFLEKDLGEEGLARSIVVAATSDQPPLVRLRGAFIATAIAEYFRDQGREVLLLMDSLTRLAHAQREIGLAIGEPPTSKGYPPSVLTLMPKVLERVGPGQRGTLTGLYTVLVDGDDLTDPIADTVRSVMDGHIVLSRDLAAKGHFPAIDVLQSISRVMPDVVTTEHRLAARAVVEMIATYQKSEDLIQLGAYRPGSNPRLDQAIRMLEPIETFVRQDIHDKADMAKSLQGLQALVAQSQSPELSAAVT